VPHLQTILGTLNTAFSKDNISKLVAKKDEFAQGKPLAAGIVIDQKMSLHGDWSKYLHRLPMAIQETIRSVIFQALSTSPPTLITFAWAPGYDYEVTIWQAPDTRTSKGGITVLIKSRYPDDKHPLQDEPPYGT
jgi:hypothetical protein